MGRIVVATILLAAAVAAPRAQKVTASLEQGHQLLLADNTSKLQAALDQAASQGLHVVFGRDQGLYLRRPGSSDGPGTYRPIADDRPEDFEKALNMAGAQGFRLLPTTLTRSGGNTLGVMQRVSGTPIVYRYRVIPSSDALDKELGDLASSGLRPIGVFTQQSGMAASLGRPGRMYAVVEGADGPTSPGAAPAAAIRYRALSTLRASTLEKELNEAAAGGYRVKGGSFMNMLLEQSEGSAKYSYRVLGAARGSTIREEIDAAARDGYRVLPSAIMANPSSKAEVVFVLERSNENPRAYKYAFVDAEGPLVAVESKVQEGFTPVALVQHGGYNILFEREIPGSSADTHQ
jgi:hypothetical protein